MNILRKLGYEGIQNEVSDSVKAFMKGTVPELEWNKEEQTMDYLVSVDETKRMMTIIRLCFKDFSWELVSDRMVY